MKDRSVAVGIMKPDAIVLSLLAPCMVKNVEFCASAMAYNRFVALIGINPWHCLRFLIFINTAYKPRLLQSKYPAKARLC